MIHGSTRQDALDAAWREEFLGGNRPDEVFVGELRPDHVMSTLSGLEFIDYRDLVRVERQTLRELQEYPE